VIFEGVPGKELERAFGQARFLRILEIGKPVPAPNPPMKALRVPAKVETELKGRRQVEDFSPFVRPPYGQPDRRVICGGV